MLAVTPLYPPASRVGAWISTHACLVALAQRGHEVTVIRYLINGDPYDLDGVTVLPPPLEPESLFADADVVISHLGDDGRAAMLARTYGKPLVRMVHGHVDNALRKLEGAALAVFNSHASAAEVPWTGPSIVVHPPIDPADYATTPGELVTLINLSRPKGGLVLARLARLMPHVRFLGVRGGYGRQETVDAPNVERMGTVVDARDIYRRTRVLLMPSQRESYGRVGLEAMCSGIPVIAHPTPGLREALGDAGIYVDRTDALGWCAQLERLADPAEWAAASAAARARADHLDPGPDLERFADAVTSLVGVPA